MANDRAACCVSES